MAVLLETSRGDLAVDLFVDECPLASKNFLKLCKIKYYNNCLFHKVVKDFIVQTGDPTGKGSGGSSVYGVMYGDQARFFEDEIRPNLKHKRKGLLSMAGAGENMNASQFFITAGSNLDSLDGKHTIFGEVAEGFDVLDSINEAFTDKDGRPLQNIRIRHTLVLDDPFDDPPELDEHIPDGSPAPEFETETNRLEDDWVPQDDQRTTEEIDESMRKEEAKSRAVVLEMIGDLPEADVKPPSNMLFVCKLNPVTTDEDLEIIFSRFGNITSCDIIRDQKTGESLNYAFLGFDDDEAAEQAYFKMNNVLIDDRRIKVDFSQSVHHIWKQFKRHGKGGGDRALAEEADQHERGPGSNGSHNPRQFGSGGRTYELKGSNHHPQMPHGPGPIRAGAAGGPPPPRGSGGGRGYGIVMDAADLAEGDDINRAPTREHHHHQQHQRRDGGGGRREAEEESERQRKRRSKEEDKHHHKESRRRNKEHKHHHKERRDSRDRDPREHHLSSRGREERDRHQQQQRRPEDYGRRDDRDLGGRDNRQRSRSRSPPRHLHRR